MARHRASRGVPSQCHCPWAMPMGRGSGGQHPHLPKGLELGLLRPPKGPSRRETEAAVLPAEHRLWGGGGLGCGQPGAGSAVQEWQCGDASGKDHVTRVQGQRTLAPSRDSSSPSGFLLPVRASPAAPCKPPRQQLVKLVPLPPSGLWGERPAHRTPAQVSRVHRRPHAACHHHANKAAHLGAVRDTPRLIPVEGALPTLQVTPKPVQTQAYMSPVQGQASLREGQPL